MIKHGPVLGRRPSDSYDHIMQSHNKAAKRLVEELRRRYFDVEGRSPAEVSDLVVRGELQRKGSARRTS